MIIRHLTERGGLTAKSTLSLKLCKAEIGNVKSSATFTSTPNYFPKGRNPNKRIRKWNFRLTSFTKNWKSLEGKRKRNSHFMRNVRRNGSIANPTVEVKRRLTQVQLFAPATEGRGQDGGGMRL